MVLLGVPGIIRLCYCSAVLRMCRSACHRCPFHALLCYLRYYAVPGTCQACMIDSKVYVNVLLIIFPVPQCNCPRFGLNQHDISSRWQDPSKRGICVKQPSRWRWREYVFKIPGRLCGDYMWPEGAWCSKEALGETLWVPSPSVGVDVGHRTRYITLEDWFVV